RRRPVPLRRYRRRVRGMTVRPVAMGIQALAALALGVSPAFAASPGPYAGFEQGAYLAYLNAPARGGELTQPPRLRISFGGRSYAVVMDTGSTGIVVSADKIPEHRPSAVAGAGPTHLFQLRPHHDRPLGRNTGDRHGPQRRRHHNRANPG